MFTYYILSSKNIIWKIHEKTKQIFFLPTVIHNLEIYNNLRGLLFYTEFSLFRFVLLFWQTFYTKHLVLYTYNSW